MAFPNNGNYFCAPATMAMMIQSQLDKPGVTVPVGSWTYNNFPPLYTTQVLAEASEMQTDPYRGTAQYNVHLGFQHPLLDVVNSDGRQSVYESQYPDYPSQMTLSDYKAKLRSGYAVGLLVDYEKEKRIYDGFPSCHVIGYEYHKNRGHFVGVQGYDGNAFFVVNPLQPAREKRSFGIMPHGGADCLSEFI